MKRRKKIKALGRPLRYRGRLKRPGQVAALKACWADPEWRAMMMEKRRAAGARRKGTGIGSRYGVPQGMRAAEAAPLNEAARVSAKETMSKLILTGALGDLDVKAAEALESAIEVMRKPGSKTVQLQAARLVLDFTKAKPASKSDITINKAEEWLVAVAAKDDDKGEAPTDA